MTEPNFSAIRARLRYESVDEFIDGYSRYVTAGGMFIPMMPAKLKPVGTTVRFQFVLGDGATALLGEGIVRQIRGLESEDANSPIGMLVKFTKLSQDSKVLIDRIVALKEVEKLGVDLLSVDEDDEANFPASAAIDSGVQEATTGSYSLEDLANSSVRTGIEHDDEDLGALFTDRTGRLQASELAGLGASAFGEKLAEPAAENEDFDEDAFAEQQLVVAQPSQDWGPEPEEIDTAGSGELSLDLFGFDSDDFESPESEQVFSKEDASADIDFRFELELSEPEFEEEEPAANDAPVFDVAEEEEEQDLLDFPAFSLSEVSADVADEDSSEEAAIEEQSIAAGEEKAADEEDAGEAVEDETIAPRVVRETLGGLQIHSFDGSADEAVDRDFEQFALGSEDDVDSMFDDVFGSAFGGAFDDSEDEQESAEDAVEFAASEMKEEEEEKPEVEEARGALDEIAAEIEALEETVMLSEPALLQPVSIPPAAPSEVVSSEVGDEASEDSLAALLFGEESESDSDELVVEGEAEAAQEVSEPESLLTNFSASEEDVEEIESEEGVGLVESSVSEDSFSFTVEEEDVSEEIVAQTPPLPPVPAKELEPAVVTSVVEEKQEEAPSELLSLLGALEDSAAEEDSGLSLGEGLSLSHGLDVPSSPEIDDEPDSLSALLANAQKELEAKSAVSEEDRQRDVLDELLGDDDLPLPPVVNSPFAVPEIIVEKKRKGFISKLFGKD